MNRRLAALVVAVVALLHTKLWAQSQTISDWQAQAPTSTQNITTLGPDLFGDQANLFNGALEFMHTDVELPGNSSLKVAVTRKHTAGRSVYVRGALGDWDLEVPRIGGIFPTQDGWLTSSRTTARCTGFSLPPYTQTLISGGLPPEPLSAQGTTAPAAQLQTQVGAGMPATNATAPAQARYWYAREFWSGHFLHIPGQPGQEVLKRNTTDTMQPGDGNAYPLVTKNRWQLRCLPTLQNGAGEGFVAVSPEGTQYRFDWTTNRRYQNTSLSGAGLPRTQVYLLATLVTDRFGNTVRYTYSGANLTRIEGSDGRLITIQYGGNGFVSAVNDASRVWNYAYDAAGNLTTVTRPDGSRWLFSLQGLVYPRDYELGEQSTCDSPGSYPEGTLSGTITHPSGAVGTFKTAYLGHPRADVQKICISKTGLLADPKYPYWPKLTVSQSLVDKTISGPGFSPLTWLYYYGGSSSWAPCNGCVDSKIVTVVDPRGFVTRHTFGIRWKVNEGQLLRVEEGWSGGVALRTTSTAYASSGGWPEPAGVSVNDFSDYLASRHRPASQQVVTQDGAAFSRQVSAFDTQARPTAASRGSSLGWSKTETTAYHDNTAKWVLGQVASVTDGSGTVQESHTFNGTTANKTASYAFGRLVESYSHHGDGNLYQRFDPASRATTFTNYKRGIAQNIAHPDSTYESAVVNNLGLVTSATNGAGTTTSYGYDAMGRLASTTYPAETGLTYVPTTQIFELVNAAEYGIAAGHWRQITSTGNAKTVRYFDALWRERVKQTYDAANVGGTSRIVETRYDADGRKLFQSDAQRGIAAVDTALPGTAWTYDALGRAATQTNSSELGNLTTSTAYLAGFQKRVTNPRGFATTFAFQAFDTPSEDNIAAIWAPEGAAVSIVRDVFGKPTSITRSGSWSGAGVSATRAYVYDGYQRLCKSIEPESGATVQAYDAANNVAWRASGLGLPSTASCDYGSVPAARQIGYGYDARNRLVSTSYGDGSAGIGRSYYADGQPYQVWSAGSTWTYGYNNRRLLVSESLAFNGGTYGFGRGIDAYGNVASLSYPDGTAVAYAPNALGEPTQVSGYASGVSFHPNGAIAGYTLANGIAHSTTQTARGLPSQWRDAGVVQDLYGYDANANVVGITDQQEGLSSRAMGYDGLDRLTAANGIWGTGSFGYDGLDNLRTSVVGGRTAAAEVDAANRLSSLTVNGAVQGYGYDANGNLTARGGQGFDFDIGNRLRAAYGKASYAYDGHGRRIWVAADDGSRKLQVYSSAGKLLWSGHSAQGNTKHIYLGDRLITEANTVSGLSFSHTDALGSPVARTNAAAQITSRTRYEAYGATAAGTNPTGIGFTGHVNDTDTGLVYMQQRYYEPFAARFLSVDPMTTEFKTGDHFNRYVYANSNPYKFKDPDGRSEIIPEDMGGRAPLGQRMLDGSPVRMSVAQSRANLQEARAAQLKTNADNGKAGEAQVKGDMGASATGSQVTFRTSDGSKTVVDITKGTSGAVEVKTGNGQLTTNQGKMQADVAVGRDVTPVGKNATDAGFTAGKPVQLDTFEVKRVNTSK